MRPLTRRHHRTTLCLPQSYTTESSLRLSLYRSLLAITTGLPANRIEYLAHDYPTRNKRNTGTPCFDGTMTRRQEHPLQRSINQRDGPQHHAA